jgi:4-amino-4-deoxy-L-arabinose transferase-like glycosyltransferase
MTSRLRPKWDSATLIAVVYFFLLLIWLGKNRLLGLDESWYGDMALAEVKDGHWFPLYFQNHPFWDKPPLIPWLQGLSLLIGGPHETALRIWSALAASLSVYWVFRLGATFGKSEKAGLVCALSLMLQPHFILSARIATLDMPLICCLLGFWWQWVLVFDPTLKPRAPRHLFASGLWLGLAVWVKSWFGLVLLPAALASLLIKRPWPFGAKQLWIRFFLPIGGALAAWLALDALTFGKAYFAWEWGFNFTGRLRDGGLHPIKDLLYSFQFYGLLGQQGLPSLWPLFPLGFALWGRDLWTRIRNPKNSLADSVGPFFFIYYSAFILFFMTTLINYFLPLVPVAALSLAFLVKAQSESKVRLATGLALLLGLLSGLSGTQYWIEILALSFLVGLIPFLPETKSLCLKASWVYALTAAWALGAGWKAQDYLRHPPDPNRVWVAAVLAHPARMKGEPLLFLGEETDARALEFYSDYQVEPIDQLPPKRPEQAVLFSVDRQAVFLPAKP